MKKRFIALVLGILLIGVSANAYMYLTHSRGAFGGAAEYTVLLAHMDGTDDAQVFTDSGAGANCPHTMTPEGNVKTEDTQKKFGATSAYFDGTGDYITLADSADWAFGSGNFTIDMWINPSAAQDNYDALYTQYIDGMNNILFDWGVSGKLRFRTRLAEAYSAYYSLTDNQTWTTGTWYHVAVVRSGTSLYIFKDGVSQSLTETTAIGANTLPDLAADLCIGGRQDNNYYFTGHIDELHISKGTARWTANFTPPTEAYSE